MNDFTILSVKIAYTDKAVLLPMYGTALIQPVPEVLRWRIVTLVRHCFRCEKSEIAEMYAWTEYCRLSQCVCVTVCVRKR